MFEPESAPVPSIYYGAPASRWPLAFVMLMALLLSAGFLALHLAPDWARRWRQVDDQAAAYAAYLKRQAELKAEAESADARLDALDERFHLVSLGFREVVRKVAPVVVHIGNEVEVAEPIPGRTFFDFDAKRHFVERAEGSGLLVKPGLVLTNEHVVRKAQRLRVAFASGRWLMAGPEDVAVDKLTDLAVIRLSASPGEPFKSDYAATAEFADSDKDVQVGDWVLAAGSPFGLKQSVSAGIVSAKGRVELRILDQVELLQTDAAINPGNSGGPLFDQRGRVVGINFAIASDNGRSEGVGFAIPSNAVQEVFHDLVEKGEVVRGFLGVGMQEVPPGLEGRLGVAATGGVVVYLVDSNSPAGLAGLRKGDVIVRYAQEAVGTVNPLSRLRQRIAHTPPDTTVPIEVIRQGEHLTLEATLVKRGPEPER
jgi:S1-C subfamily serine protease